VIIHYVFAKDNKKLKYTLCIVEII